MPETAARRALSDDRVFDTVGQETPSFRPSQYADAVGRSYRGGGLPRQALYVLIDLLMLCVGSMTAYWIRFGPLDLAFTLQNQTGSHVRFLPMDGYAGFVVLYAALIILACMTQDLYRTRRELSSVAETVAVSKAVGLATAVLILFIFTSGNTEISRLVVICSGLMNVVTFSGWRYAKRQLVSHRMRRGIGIRRALIVGAGESGRQLAAAFEQNSDLGYRVCGFLDPHPNGDPRVRGTVGELRRVALEEFVDEVFVTTPVDRDLVKRVFTEARKLKLDTYVVPELYDGLARNTLIRTIGGFPAMLIHGQPIPAFGLAMKRLIDVVGSVVGLIVTAPVLLLAAIWIRIDTPGPIFYPAFRVGKKGQKFRCYKLRTMVNHADRQKKKLRVQNERKGPFFKLKNDPRITTSGRWLRKYSIDELPQLFNVLVGNMSLVGPRPHPVDDFERYQLEDFRRLEVKPGVTGLWQISARSDPSFETSMALDLEYIDRWGLILDLRILIMTAVAVCKGEGQ